MSRVINILQYDIFYFFILALDSLYNNSVYIICAMRDQTYCTRKFSKYTNETLNSLK